MDGTTRRICSHDPLHDLALADETAKNCPICGHRLVIQPISETVAAGDDVVTPEQEQVLPEPAVVCGRDPHHDVSRRAAEAETCPYPGCGGRLIQLQCQADPTHDVGQIGPDQTACPVCRKPLVTAVCANEAGHSMLHRVADQNACPVCGSRVRFDIHKIAPPPPVDPEPQPKPEPPTHPPRSFWRRLTSAAGLIGYVVCWGACYLLINSIKDLTTNTGWKLFFATIISLIILTIFIGANWVIRSIFRLFKPSQG